jgi:hypothetical protein
MADAHPDGDVNGINSNACGRARSNRGAAGRLTGRHRVVLDANNPGDPWPPVDSEGIPQPWVFVELDDTDASIIGFGTPTNNTVLDSGICKFHVMVPKDEGLSAPARLLSLSAKSSVRQQFFADEAGVASSHLTPRVGREASVDDGNWVSMTCTLNTVLPPRLSAIV